VLSARNIYADCTTNTCADDTTADTDACAVQLSGLVSNNDTWIGGKTHLVQLGDILDRGDDERHCMDLLFKLKEEAREAGGQVQVLLGNHEVRNVDLDFRYVTQNAWEGWGEPPKSGSMCLDIKVPLYVSSSYYILLYYSISFHLILLYYYIGKPGNRGVPSVREAACAGVPPWRQRGEAISTHACRHTGTPIYVSSMLYTAMCVSFS